MQFRKSCVTVCAAAIGFATAVGAFALADSAKPGNAAAPAGQPEMKLPPGWTEADAQACMIAGTPGEMHKKLAEHLGTWEGKTSLWMMPDSEPMTSTSKSVVTSMMDGRYLKIEMTGEMPGMGLYNGFGLMGFDNVRQKLVATWIDNQSTKIMNGTGEMSKDGKTLTIEYDYTCPVTKKPAVMREVETVTGPNTKVFEMFGAEPKSGKEFKMMRIEWTKK